MFVRIGHECMQLQCLNNCCVLFNYYSTIYDVTLSGTMVAVYGDQEA